MELETGAHVAPVARSTGGLCRHGLRRGAKRDFGRCRSRQLAPILGCRVMQFVVTILETTGKGAPSCPQCDLRFRH